jgi:hypothetical protein
MTFILDGRDQLSRVLNSVGDSAVRLHQRLNETSSDGSKALDALKSSIVSLAPAAIPAAAALAPIAAATAAAGVAAGVYAVALGPQIAAMGEASKAEEKYQDAVEESGATSADAVKAQAEYARQMAKLPAPTRQAAAQLSVLKDEYRAWSDSLAKDTMGPFNKGLALSTALLPKLTPMVRGTSTELDRMVTIAGGGMASPGFDRLMAKFTEFATGSLRRANDGLISFLRNAEVGKVGGGISEFLDYARAQGPLAADTLKNIGTALMNVLKASSEVGVGLLQAVNALARLVASVPAGAIATFLQLAIALKAARLAAAGFVALRGGIAAMGGALLAMRTAAGGAAGGLASAAAAIGAMSRAAKVAIAGAAIGLLVIAVTELANLGKRAPADLDKMSTSLSKFGQSGKLTGEAARVLGKDFREFDEALRGMARPGQLDQMQQSFTKFFGQDSTPVKRWKSVLDDVDKSLASMVQSGNADLAAQAFSMLAKRAREEGMTTGELSEQLGDYQAALGDVAFEQKLAADSMGLFGAQAQSVQGKLDAQRQATDGLRQSIIALNEVNRKALEGRAGMEAAIDAATEATKKHSNALKFVNGELDLNSSEARDAAAVLTDLARKTEENVTSARDSGKSWAYAKGEYDRGRASLLKSADAMGLTKDQARRLADQILKTPNKTAYLKGNLEDLQRKLADAKDRLKKVPDSRKAQVRADIRDLEAKIRKAKSDIASVRGKTVTITTKYVVVGDGSAARKQGSEGSQLKNAKGGLIRGPGTGTSDSIVSRVSNGEFVVRASSVSKYGVDTLRAINEGRFDKAAQVSGKAAVATTVGRPAGGSSLVQQVNVRIDVSGAIDPIATAKAIQKQLLNLKRVSGVNVELKVG